MVSMIRITAPKAAQAQSGTVTAKSSDQVVEVPAVGTDLSSVPLESLPIYGKK